MMLLTLRTKVRDELWGAKKFGYRVLEQRHRLFAEPPQDIAAGHIQLGGRGVDQCDHLIIGVIAERGIGAGYSGIVEQVVPESAPNFSTTASSSRL